MNQLKCSEPVSANTFHAGNTCPHCQEPIAVGQWVVTCSQCGSLHHETCWGHKGGCSSYHCDNSVRTNSESLNPDIVIRTADLANVRVPPPQLRRSAQEITAQFLPKKPERLSRLALISAVTAGAALCGMAGVIAGKVNLTIIGLFLSMAALALGVIALVIISNAENRVHGFPVALAGVAGPVLLIFVYLGTLHGHYQRQSKQTEVDLKLAEDMPTEQQLARESPATARAMRANVVIKCVGFGEIRYGSGVVTRLDEHHAYILTNKHVIGADKSGINVLFYNGEQSTASLEWSAPGDVDLCFISCQALTLNKYEPIVVADKLATPGERAFAIGNPSGLPWSYTEGAISGVRTSKPDAVGLNVYQTQTPINHGNSGGGLYNMDGQLIGINTWTEDKTVSEGLNFSIATTGLLQMLKPEDRDKLLQQHTENAERLPKKNEF